MFANDDWDRGRMMDGSYGGMSNGGVWMMIAFGLLLLVLVGITVFLAIKAAGAPAPTGPGVGQHASPREVLDLRLARGEMSPEDYNTARDLLGS
jgi:uncharacterized membrane protein